jgi:hypothetical protein
VAPRNQPRLVPAQEPAPLLDEPGSPPPQLNRTQVLVLAFFAAALMAVVAILALAPDVFDQALKSPFADRLLVEVAFVVAISLFLVILGTGVVRKWRWMFWLILLAFLTGVLRPAASALELAGTIPLQGPAWYVVLQGAIGLVQFAIGMAMVAGYRHGGAWGRF